MPDEFQQGSAQGQPGSEETQSPSADTTSAPESSASAAGESSAEADITDPIDQALADLVDDLGPIYAKDNTPKGRAEREQWRKNKAYVDAMNKQKHLME